MDTVGDDQRLPRPKLPSALVQYLANRSASLFEIPSPRLSTS
jgi:hypothetical protein